MNDGNETNEHLLAELAAMRQRIQELETRELENHRQHLEQLVEARTRDLIEVNERLRQEIKERQQIEAALRESEERYRTLVESSPASLLAIRNGRYIFTNPAGAHMLGYTDPQDIVGLPAIDTIAPTSRALVEQRLQNLRKGEKNPPVELDLQRPDGSILSTESISIPIVLNGQPTGLIIGQDITARKQAEAALQESRSELSLRQQIATILLTAPEDRVYAHLLNTILGIFESEYGYVGYIDDNGDLVSTSLTQTVWDICQITNKNIVFPKESWRGIWGKSLLERRAFFSNDGLRLPEGHVPLRNALAVPILLDGDLIGQITIANKPADYTEQDQDKLETIASYLAPLLQNRLEKEKKEQERKQAVEALVQSEYIMRALIDAIDDSLFLIETDGTIVVANKALAARFGREPGTLVNTNAFDLTSPEVTQHRKSFVNQAIASGKPVHFEDARQGHLIANSIYPIVDEKNRVTRLAIYGQDITTQRRAEDKLRESLQTAADIVTSIPSGLFIYQYEPPDQLILLQGNLAAAQITGLNPDDWIGKEFNEIWPNARETGVTEAFLSPLKTGKPFETENLHYSDERITGAYRIRAFLMPGNRLSVAFEDITKRKQAEEAEREQRALAEALVDTAEAINQTLDFDEVLKRILHVIKNVTPHDGANIMLVHEATQTIQVVQHCSCYKSNGLQNPQLLISWKLSDLPHLQQIVNCGEPLIIQDTYVNPGWARNKSLNPIRSYLGTPILVDGKVIGIINLDSITPNFFTINHKEHLKAFAKQAAIAIQNARLHENVRQQLVQLREAQTRLIQSEKLAAIGELVAGVAHELNNPLTGVILYAQLLQRRKDKAAAEKDVQQIITQARRASDIVRGLLDFARQRPPAQTPTLINDVLQSTVSLLAYELRTHNVEVVTYLDANLPLIMVDPHQLQQVFVNLLSNALQAMEANQGGCIEIHTTMGRSQFLQQADAPAMVRITFRDNGPGIPEALQTRIFDPFFTTKELGKGTGLGLSVCHGIIREHGGYIWAKSKAGEGAVFFIELPVYLGETLVTPTNNQEEEVSFGAKDARILIVDDEQSILNVMSLILRRYQVDQVESGEAALQKLATAVYDLIICDIHMPGMNGIELYNHIQQAYPYLARRFLFITGDTVNSHTKETLTHLGMTILPKPFEMGTLLATMHTILHPALLNQQ